MLMRDFQMSIGPEPLLMSVDIETGLISERLTDTIWDVCGSARKTRIS